MNVVESTWAPAYPFVPWSPAPCAIRSDSWSSAELTLAPPWVFPLQARLAEADPASHGWLLQEAHWKWVHADELSAAVPGGNRESDLSLLNISETEQHTCPSLKCSATLGHQFSNSH